MAQSTSVKAIREKLSAIRADIAKLQAQEAVLVELLEGEPTPPKKRRSNVKTTVLELLEEAGEGGLNAASAVEIARMRGIELERGTVSSLLSRLKSEGIVEYDSKVYRLASVQDEPATIHPLRTSGGAFD